MKFGRKIKSSKLGDDEGISTAGDSSLQLKVKATRAADLVPLSFSPSSGCDQNLDDLLTLGPNPKSHKRGINPVLVCMLNNVRKSTVKRIRTSNPSWDDEIILPLSNGDYSPMLSLMVRDKHKRYLNYLGELRMNIGALFLQDGFRKETGPTWYSLHSSSQSQTYTPGSLLLSFELISKSSRKSKPRKVESARNVPTIVIENDSSDEKVVTHSPLGSGGNPDESILPLFESWLRSLVHPYQDPALTVLNEDGFYTDNDAFNYLDASDAESVVGAPFLRLQTSSPNLSFGGLKKLSSDLEVRNLEPEAARTDWLRLADHNDDLSISELSASSDGSYMSDEPGDGASISKITPPKSKLDKKAVSLGRKMAKKRFELSNRKVLGMLFIEIESVSDLPPLSNFTKTSFDMDPFVVVTFGKKTFRTSWQRHTLNPVFNERLTFEIMSYERNYNLQFSVLDKDHFSFHDKVATFSMPVQDIVDMAHADQLLPKDSNVVDSDSALVSSPDPEIESLNSNIQILLDDNMIPKVRKQRFTKRKKITSHYTDTSKFKSMNLALTLHNHKYAEDYHPHLKIRARFETYDALRVQLWNILLLQSGMNNNQDEYECFELVSWLEMLGCTESEDVAQNFYDQLRKTTSEVLYIPEIIEALETYTNDPVNHDVKILDLERCPVCFLKRLHKKDDVDIVTHVAVCASKDWSIVSKLLVSSFVTPELASKKWISKFLIKLTYGKYQLGSNSANILVQDRTTGVVLEEKMGIYVRLGIRLLYKGLDKAKSRRVRELLKRLSFKQGIKFDSPALQNEIAPFIKFHKLDLSDCLETDISKYSTFNEFFYRKLKPNARPVEGNGDARTAVSPADCRCAAFETVTTATELWIKGRNFTVAKLFNGNFNNYENTDIFKHEECSLGIFRLAPQDYHRFHSPVDGTIKELKHIDGEYYTVNPMAIRSELDVFGENIRTIIPIETNEFGTVIMCAVGAMMVGSTVLTVKEGDIVKRGDEIGYFKFGGSTIILLFQKKQFQFDRDLIENSKNCIETLCRVGQSIGHSPEIPAVKRHVVEFGKQTKEFKLQLIRAMTGGDLSTSKEFSSWESAHTNLTERDMQQLVIDDADDNC